MFLKSIYVFTTFKLIPEDVMKQGLVYVGLNKEELVNSTETKSMTEDQSVNKRQLVELMES